MVTDVRRSLWRDGDFLKLWGGEAVSLLGSQITLLALPLTAMLLLDATPADLGFIAAAGFLPFLVVTLFAGVWVDRHRRRPVMIGANLGRAAALAAIPALAATGLLEVWHLVLTAFITGIGTVFFDLAHQSFLPTVLSRERLIEGNAKLQTSEAVAEVAGPGLAGLLVQLVSAPIAIMVDVVSFLVSAITLSTIRRPETSPDQIDHDETSTWAQISQGLRFVIGDRRLRAMAGEATMWNLGFAVIDTVFLLYVIDEIGLAPGTVGVVLSIGAIGAVLGAMLTGPLQQRVGLGRAMIAVYAVACLAPLLIPLAAPPATTAIPILVAAFFLVGLGVAGSQVYIYSLRQAITPDHLLGRMNSGYRFFVTGMLPPGALLGGLLGEVIGLRPTILVGAGVVALALVWVFVSPIPRLRSLPTETT